MSSAMRVLAVELQAVGRTDANIADTEGGVRDMSYIASDIGTIPAYGFAWYVLYLEDVFDDPLKDELSRNFLALGSEVGRDVLVVRGFDPQTFYSSAYETLTLYDEEWAAKIQRPALLLSDTPPRLLLSEKAKLNAAKLILFPLAPFRRRPAGTLVDLLRQLVAALKDNDAMSALQQLEPKALRSKWGWLSKYVDMKPNFMGFGVNLNAAIDDVVLRPQDG
jgi:hypothetical protein